MTTTKLFTIAVLLTAVLLATLTAAQSVEPIWLSPPLAGNYDPEYPELGVWTNISVGAGARYLVPVVAMDSNKTLWIMHGGSTTSSGYNVWNYDPQTDLYRWVAGPGNSTIDPRNPGELRVPSPDNHPGPITLTSGAIDHNDNIWFMSTFAHTGELWMFNTTLHYFTRMKGLDEETATNYGTLGTPSDDVSPGVIYGGCLVVDSSDNLWQIAGIPVSGSTNRVWHFNTTSYQWTFFGGSTSKVFTPTRYDNDPYYGGRFFQGCDIDDNDRVWLSGGQGSSSYYNDVWSYDTRALQWQLEFGSSASVNANATVAVENDFDAGNHPASATFPSFVDRKDGTLMFINAQKGTNDIWLFHKTLRQWKLVYGDPFNSNPNGNFSHYRTPGSVMPGNLYTHGSAHGLNINGDIFIYGGGIIDSINNNNGLHNSIWLISHDQCTTSTSNNCSLNARCIERDIGYSCECNDSFIGDGFACQSTLPPVSPNSPSSSSNEPMQSPSDEPVASPSSPTPLSSSHPSSTPHRKPRVSRGVTVESSLFIALSLAAFALEVFY